VFAAHIAVATPSESVGIISNFLCDLGELRVSVVDLPTKNKHQRDTEQIEEAQRKTVFYFSDRVLQRCDNPRAPLFPGFQSKPWAGIGERFQR